MRMSYSGGLNEIVFEVGSTQRAYTLSLPTRKYAVGVIYGLLKFLVALFSMLTM